MSIKAEIIQDSISPTNNRLTTFVLTFPRWILAELNTHRSLSRNVASSRAIPFEKMVQAIQEDPAIPVFWGKNAKGMQSLEELSETKIVDAFFNFEGIEIEFEYEKEKVSEKEAARRAWLNAKNKAIAAAISLDYAGLHKQYVNRAIENFMYVRAIVSATNFENFFALRAHKDAQPEIAALAYKMLEEYNKSEPKSLNYGDWHIPFGNKIDSDRIFEEYVKKLPIESVHVESIREGKMKVAVARCARISYLNYEGKDDYEADIKLFDRLVGGSPKHLSPTEHVAQCLDNDAQFGNFKGWKQYRYLFADQNLTDSRVIKKTWTQTKS